MAAANRFHLFRSRASVLARRLPKAQPTGNYSDKQYDAVRAYRLLVHAELESCLEDLSREVLARSYNRFLSAGEIRPALTYICARYGDNLSEQELKQEADPRGEAIKRAVQSHHKAISSNNGVKDINVLQLVGPLGIRRADLDPLWLADMTTFGSSRGDTAHLSFGAQIPPDPVSEKAIVSRIVIGVGQLQQALNALA